VTNRNRDAAQRSRELVLAFPTVELELLAGTHRNLIWFQLVVGAPAGYLGFVVEIRELQVSLSLRIAFLCNCSGGFSLHFSA